MDVAFIIIFSRFPLQGIDIDNVQLRLLIRLMEPDLRWLMLLEPSR